MHFIKVLELLFQSVNIRFETFIKELMALIISNENKFKILEEYNNPSSSEE